MEYTLRSRINHETTTKGPRNDRSSLESKSQNSHSSPTTQISPTSHQQQSTELAAIVEKEKQVSGITLTESFAMDFFVRNGAREVEVVNSLHNFFVGGRDQCFGLHGGSRHCYSLSLLLRFESLLLDQRRCEIVRERVWVAEFR